LLLPQGLALMSGFFLAALELGTWLLGTSDLLMALGSVVGRILVLVEYNYLLSILLFIFYAVLLNFTLKLDEFVALLFN
jgi:hypothetical protein